MPGEMTVRELASIGGQARACSLTPEQRQAIARRASLARAVARVLDHWPEVRPEARRRFAELVQEPEEAGQ
jgi:D-alanyl-D-alanine dipeptidase